VIPGGLVLLPLLLLALLLLVLLLVDGVLAQAGEKLLETPSPLRWSFAKVADGLVQLAQIALDLRVVRGDVDLARPLLALKFLEERHLVPLHFRLQIEVVIVDFVGQCSGSGWWGSRLLGVARLLRRLLVILIGIYVLQLAACACCCSCFCTRRCRRSRCCCCCCRRPRRRGILPLSFRLLERSVVQRALSLNVL